MSTRPTGRTSDGVSDNDPPALTPSSGPKYFVQLEEHVYIHDLPPAARTLVGRVTFLSRVRGPQTARARRSACWKLPRRLTSLSRMKNESDFSRSEIAEVERLSRLSNS